VPVGRTYAEVPGGRRRWYADGEDTIHVVPDSRNLPAEFTESRFPLRERLAAVDSGGLGQFWWFRYEKLHPRPRDGPSTSPIDPVMWGVRGGLAGRPFQVTIDPDGPNEREADALADAEPIRAGIRIRQPVAAVGEPFDRKRAGAADVRDGKVSADLAQATTTASW
jgi:N-methylhydantoinase B